MPTWNESPQDVADMDDVISLRRIETDQSFDDEEMASAVL